MKLKTSLASLLILALTAGVARADLVPPPPLKAIGGLGILIAGSALTLAVIGGGVIWVLLKQKNKGIDGQD